MPKNKNDFEKIITTFINKFAQDENFFKLIGEFKILSSITFYDDSTVMKRSLQERSSSGSTLPLIVIYPNKGKDVAQQLLNEIYDMFKNYGGCGVEPAFNKKITDLIFYAQGNRDDKTGNWKEYFSKSLIHYGSIHFGPGQELIHPIWVDRQYSNIYEIKGTPLFHDKISEWGFQDIKIQDQISFENLSEQAEKLNKDERIIISSQLVTNSKDFQLHKLLRNPPNKDEFQLHILRHRKEYLYTEQLKKDLNQRLKEIERLKTNPINKIESLKDKTKIADFVSTSTLINTITLQINEKQNEIKILQTKLQHQFEIYLFAITDDKVFLIRSARPISKRKLKNALKDTLENPFPEPVYL